jgi:hypothetical protein
VVARIVPGARTVRRCRGLLARRPDLSRIARGKLQSGRACRQIVGDPRDCLYSDRIIGFALPQELLVFLRLPHSTQPTASSLDSATIRDWARCAARRYSWQSHGSPLQDLVSAASSSGMRSDAPRAQMVPCCVKDSNYKRRCIKVSDESFTQTAKRSLLLA